MGISAQGTWPAELEVSPPPDGVSWEPDVPQLLSSPSLALSLARGRPLGTFVGTRPCRVPRECAWLAGSVPQFPICREGELVHSPHLQCEFTVCREQAPGSLVWWHTTEPTHRLGLCFSQVERSWFWAELSAPVGRPGCLAMYRPVHVSFLKSKTGWVHIVAQRSDQGSQSRPSRAVGPRVAG